MEAFRSLGRRVAEHVGYPRRPGNSAALCSLGKPGG